MKKDFNKCIVVLGTQDSGKSQFIECCLGQLDENLDNVKIVDYKGTQTLEEHHPDAVIIIFDPRSRLSIYQAVNYFNHFNIPRFVVANCSKSEQKDVTCREFSKYVEKKGCIYQEMAVIDSTTVIQSLTYFLNKLDEQDEYSYQTINIPMSESKLKRIKQICTLMSILTAISGITVLIIGSFEAIQHSENITHGLTDSLLTSGILSFMVSFLGFYGTKGDGIREYLKAVIFI